MMRLKTAYLFITLLVLSFIVSNCSKEKTLIPVSSNGINHSPWSDITAGYTENSVFVEVNDTLDGSFSSMHNKHLFDFDQDGSTDMELSSQFSIGFGQTKFYYSTNLYLHPNCEVLIDSSDLLLTRYTQYYCYPDSSYTVFDTSYTVFHNLISPVKRPKILNYGDLIDQNSSWYHGAFGISINSRFNNYMPEPPCEIYEMGSMMYWAQEVDKYIGFRLIQPNDTLYGWIKLNFKSNSATYVEIEKYAVR